jgi:hypothetical protein
MPLPKKFRTKNKRNQITNSFQGEKIPSVRLLEKYFVEVSLGAHIGEIGIEIGWDGSPAPERAYLSLFDLFLKVLCNRLQMARGGRE